MDRVGSNKISVSSVLSALSLHSVAGQPHTTWELLLLRSRKVHLAEQALKAVFKRSPVNPGLWQPKLFSCVL